MVVCLQHVMSPWARAGPKHVHASMWHTLAASRRDHIARIRTHTGSCSRTRRQSSSGCGALLSSWPPRGPTCLPAALLMPQGQRHWQRSCESILWPCSGALLRSVHAALGVHDGQSTQPESAAWMCLDSHERELLSENDSEGARGRVVAFSDCRDALDACGEPGLLLSLRRHHYL